MNSESTPDREKKASSPAKRRSKALIAVALLVSFALISWFQDKETIPALEKNRISLQPGDELIKALNLEIESFESLQKELCRQKKLYVLVGSDKTVFTSTDLSMRFNGKVPVLSPGQEASAESPRASSMQWTAWTVSDKTIQEGLNTISIKNIGQDSVSISCENMRSRNINSNFIIWSSPEQERIALRKKTSPDRLEKLEFPVSIYLVSAPRTSR